MSQSDDSVSPARSPVMKDARPEALGAPAATRRDVAGPVFHPELAPPPLPPQAPVQPRVTDDKAAAIYLALGPTAQNVDLQKFSEATGLNKQHLVETWEQFKADPPKKSHHGPHDFQKPHTPQQRRALAVINAWAEDHTPNPTCKQLTNVLREKDEWKNKDEHTVYEFVRTLVKAKHWPARTATEKSALPADAAQNCKAFLQAALYVQRNPSQPFAGFINIDALPGPPGCTWTWQTVDVGLGNELQRHYEAASESEFDAHAVHHEDWEDTFCSPQNAMRRVRDAVKHTNERGEGGYLYWVRAGYTSPPGGVRRDHRGGHNYVGDEYNFDFNPDTLLPQYPPQGPAAWRAGRNANDIVEKNLDTPHDCYDERPTSLRDDAVAPRTNFAPPAQLEGDLLKVVRAALGSSADRAIAYLEQKAIFSLALFKACVAVTKNANHESEVTVNGTRVDEPAARACLFALINALRNTDIGRDSHREHHRRH